uniref:Uncharacterized protein n=1 Tax=viral metagenome TaxID=1070528 RepID=A0A6C0BQF4_9ZZZZ
MSNNILCIVPNTLFRKSFIVKICLIYEIDKCFIWEYTDFFCKYEYNKKKLILHRASMQSYFNNIKNIFLECIYLSFSDDLINFLKPNDKLFMFENIEFISRKNITRDIIFITSPSFLLTNSQLQKIHIFFKNQKNTKKTIPSFEQFIKISKVYYNMEVDLKHYEHASNYINTEVTIQSLLEKRPYFYNSFVKEAIAYVNNFFSKNCGDCLGFELPIDHNQTRIFLNDLLKQDKVFFELYQDVLSCSLNIGLLNPNDVILEMNKHDVQSVHYNLTYYLIYREYKRYIYIYHYLYVLKCCNPLGFQKSTSYKWNNCTTGMYHVHITISKGIDSGILTEREIVYILGHSMFLHEIHPLDAFKWFMQSSINSYEWFMFYTIYVKVYTKYNRMLWNTSENILNRFQIKGKYDWPKILDDVIITFKQKHKLLLKQKHQKI